MEGRTRVVSGMMKWLMLAALIFSFTLYPAVRSEAADLNVEDKGKWEPETDSNIEVDNMTTGTSSTATLDKVHLVVNGNLMAKGTITLKNGSVLEVRGDYCQESGRLDIASDSEIKVTGNMYFRTQKADGTYSSSSAGFYPSAGSVTRVGKDFVWDSTGNDQNFKGDFYIGGNLIVPDDSTLFYGDVYLESEEPATIDISEDVGLISLHTKNQTVNVARYISIKQMENNMTLVNPDDKICTGSYYLNANGHELLIDGDFIVSVSNSVTTADGGKITVNGDMQCLTGSIYVVNDAQLDVKGNLLFEKLNAAGEAASVSAGFYPRQNSQVKIGGDFVWNSTGNDLNIYGDLHIGKNILIKNDDTILKGNVYMESKEPTTVQLGKEARIVSLYTTNPEVNIVKYLNVSNFQNDVTLKNQEGKIYTTTYFGVNGHAVTVDADLITSGELSTGDGGKLTVTGDFEALQGKVNVNSSSALNVEGNLLFEKYDSDGEASTVSAAFYPQSNSITTVKKDFIWNSTGNALNLRGDMILYGNYIDKRGANWNGKVKLMAKGQKVTIAGSGKIKTLELTSAKSDYTFSPDPCWTELIESGGSTPSNQQPSNQQQGGQQQGSQQQGGQQQGSQQSGNPAASDTKTIGDVGTVLVQITDANGVYFISSNKEGALTVEYVGPVNKKKTVSVPGKVQDANGNVFTVTKIGFEAFTGNQKLKSVKIPASVNVISTRAFKGCKKLKRIEINGNSLKSVKSGAFKNISSKAVFTIKAKNKKTFNKVCKMIKKAGAKKATFKYKKSK